MPPPGPKRPILTLALLAIAIVGGAVALVVTRNPSRAPGGVAADAPPIAHTATGTAASTAGNPPPPPPTDRRAGDRDPAPRAPRAADAAHAMEPIRAAVREDPDRALALLDAADHADPDGPFAEERAALRVDALVVARRIGLARDAAEEFLRRYPRGPRAQHIEMLTGVHPRPPDPQD